MSPSNVVVVGTGYVGLTTGTCLAELGHRVSCVDIDTEKVKALKLGQITIFEPGLSELLTSNIEAERLTFHDNVGEVISGAEIVFLCLPTPQTDDGAANLSYVGTAVQDLAQRLDPGTIVVCKSTVPVGTHLIIERWLDRPDVHVASNPEFLREGAAVSDFLNPDRVVIGARTEETAARIARLYDQVDTDIILTDLPSAETIKYAANAFLATKVSFANAIAALAESVNADALAVLDAIGKDRRIGPAYLNPGPGWGGSCFPKDTRAMVSTAEQRGYDFAFLKSVIEVNDQQFDRMISKVSKAAGGSLVAASIGLLGLAFKAGTDDVRDSPALTIANRLQAAGSLVKAYDPQAIHDPLSPIARADSPYAAAEGVDVLVIATEWPEFGDLDLDRLRDVMKRPVIVDMRNVLDPATARAAGFDYTGVGRQ